MNKELELAAISEKIYNLTVENSKLMQDICDNNNEKTKLLSKSNKIEGLRFYAYIVFVDGVVKYIGKGSGDRWKHSVGGGSHVPEINRDFFAGEHIEVRAWLGNATSSEAEALKDETDLIYSVLYDGGSLYNKTIPVGGCYLNCCFKEYSSFLGSVDGFERVETDSLENYDD